MIKLSFFSFIVFALLIFAPMQSASAGLAEKLSGRILLNVEKNGEAWYVLPNENKRYFLGRPKDAFEIMRKKGLGITEIDFQKIAQAGMDVTGDLELAGKLSGRIVLQVEKNGEAWYINPVDLKKYFLGRPKDAFRIMRELSLGISRENLAKIHKTGLFEKLNEFSSYEHKKIYVKGASYSVDLVEINLDNPKLKILSSAESPTPDDIKDKAKTHGANTLANFVYRNNAFAGINGTYFCAYGGCGLNYYFYPVYDTNSQSLINKGELKYWTTGPIIAFDTNNNFYYFKDSREFGGLENFSDKYNAKISALIGNKPRLVEEGKNLLIDWDLDNKQKNVKSYRNAIGYIEKNNSKGLLLLVVVKNATVPDLAEIMKFLKADYALNLDGGLSSALYYNDEYMVGPGRDVPNAILFSDSSL